MKAKARGKTPPRHWSPRELETSQTLLQILTGTLSLEQTHPSGLPEPLSR